MKYILTDIEGTTTSISFVHDVLFPYSKENLRKYLMTNSDKKNIHDLLFKIDNNINLENCITLLMKWIDEDKKHPVLKALQGLIWDDGYKSGVIKGHLYEDVPIAFEKWISKGLKIGIYSSGSVHAQKLLFSHSQYGDLTRYLSNYFDTEVGMKRESQSYINISKLLNLAPKEILFLSDIQEELDEAQIAGLKTIQLVRDGDVPYCGHKQVSSFSEI